MNLRQLLKDKVNGGSFISLDSYTEITLKGGKSNPLNGRVFKRVTGANVMVFQNKNNSAYDAMVRRRLVAEGKDPDTFELSERRWGTRIPNEPIVQHNNGMYLEVIFLRPGIVEVLVDGDVITDPYYVIPGYDRKEEADQGGLGNKVIIRTYKFESIKAITIDHQRYEFE